MSSLSPKPRADNPGLEPSGAVTGRLYSGLQSSERATERHARLIEAGIEVFGTVGYPAAKIKTLCQEAGLSERYFYESFESREHLLTSVYTQMSAELMQRTRQAIRERHVDVLAMTRAGIAAVVSFMLDDPRHAQIILVEIVGVSPALEATRHKSLSAFAVEAQKLLVSLAGLNPAAVFGARGAQDGQTSMVLDMSRLTGVAIVGGVNNTLLDALRSGTTANTERITEALFQLICNASTGLRGLAAP